MDGSTVTIAAVAPGAADVTATATNEHGLSASQTFRVAVTVPLPDREEVSGDALTLPLASLAANASAGVEYAAASSRDAVVEASIAGALLTLVAGDSGVAIITVTATGADGWHRTLGFQVETVAMPRFLKSWRVHWIRQVQTVRKQ